MEPEAPPVILVDCGHYLPPIVGAEDNNDSAVTVFSEFGCQEIERLPWNPIRDWHNLSACGEDAEDIASDRSDNRLRVELGRTLKTGCFINMRFHCMDETAHVCDAFRSSPTRKETATHILRRLGVVPLDFHLEDPSNIRFLNPTWHIALVKYGMWTWAPSEEALLYMLAILKSERAARQRYFERFGDAPWRKFVPTWITSDFLKFEPRLLFPKVLLLPDEPVLRWETDEFCAFYSGDDGHLHDVDGHRLLPFPSEGLNPFLVALSAHDKLSHYFRKRRAAGRPDASSPHLHYYFLLSELIEQIYSPLDPVFDQNRTIRPVQLNMDYSMLAAGSPQDLPTGTSPCGSGSGGRWSGSGGGMKDTSTPTSTDASPPSPSPTPTRLSDAATPEEPTAIDEFATEAYDYASNSATGMRNTSKTSPADLVTATDGSPANPFTLKERIDYGRALLFDPPEDFFSP